MSALLFMSIATIQMLMEDMLATTIDIDHKASIDFSIFSFTFLLAITGDYMLMTDERDINSLKLLDDHYWMGLLADIAIALHFKLGLSLKFKDLNNWNYANARNLVIVYYASISLKICFINAQMSV